MSIVRAAGGIPVRRVHGCAEVLVVYRPHYDDWTFPKGKCEPGEADEVCALREVAEETGLRCALGHELPSTEYLDGKGRPKTVRYWLLEVVGGDLLFEHEVTEARWLSTGEAARLLTYSRDIELLDSVLQLAP